MGIYDESISDRIKAKLESFKHPQYKEGVKDYAMKVSQTAKNASTDLLKRVAEYNQRAKSRLKYRGYAQPRGRAIQPQQAPLGSQLSFGISQQPLGLTAKKKWR
jgi:hypothetical protein